MIRTVLERFVEHSPMAIMARLVMQCAVDDPWLDSAESDDAEREPVREALLACVADALVAIGTGTRAPAGAAGFVPPAMSAAPPPAMSPEFAPAVTALHDRMSRLRAGWGRALVRDGAALLQPLAARRPGAWAEAAAGLRVRVLDGGAMPASLACTPGPDGCVHGFAGDLPDALPAVLPVYDPEYGMVVDLVPCERGRAHERALVAALLESVQAGELWILDGRFGTAGMLSGWPRGGGLFLIREHGCAPAWQACEAPRDLGELDGGVLHEQAVMMPGAPAVTDNMPGVTNEAVETIGEAAMCLRRIEWRPRVPGVEPLSLLTNAAAGLLDAARLMRLARLRWREALPLPVEPVFDAARYAELPARAVPLARGIVATAYNVFSVMTGAVAGELELDARELERLPLHVAAGVRLAYAGMMIALPPAWWRRYDHLSIGSLGTLLGLLAHHVDPRSERRRRREHRVSAKSQALLRTATLDRLLHDDNDELASNVFNLRTIAMATRDFSSNPSKALRHAGEALVMVTKYNRPIALLVSIEDWNRLLGEVRETSVSRLSLDGGAAVQRVQSLGFGEVPLN